MSAGIYAARKKIKTLILTKNFGGQIIEAYPIDNYLGVPGLLGVELAQKFREHLMNFEKNKSQGVFDLEIKENEVAQRIERSNTSGYLIKGDKGSYETKTIIIATGKAERKLDIKGAGEFEGKGISYCTTCDAPLFRDKIVAVIGAGDSGQDAAWELAKYASKVYFLNKYPELRGDNVDLQQQLKKESKIEILNEVVPIQISGEKFVSSLTYKDLKAGEQETLMVNGIFVEIGSIPATAFLGDLVKRNEKGEIIVDHNSCATSASGIFAAGDATDVSEKQIVIAAGMGARAALSAYEYLKGLVPH